MPEGPYQVHTWPAEIWAGAEADLARAFAAAEAEFWSCPEPQGQAARDAVYGNGNLFTWAGFLDLTRDDGNPYA